MNCPVWFVVPDQTEDWLTSRRVAIRPAPVFMSVTRPVNVPSALVGLGAAYVPPQVPAAGAGEATPWPPAPGEAMMSKPDRTSDANRRSRARGFIMIAQIPLLGILQPVEVLGGRQVDGRPDELSLKESASAATREWPCAPRRAAVGSALPPERGGRLQAEDVLND